VKTRFHKVCFFKWNLYRYIELHRAGDCEGVLAVLSPLAGFAAAGRITITGGGGGGVGGGSGGVSSGGGRSGGGGGGGATVAVNPEVGESVVLTYTACVYALKQRDLLPAAVKLLHLAARTYPASAAVALNAGSMAGEVCEMDSSRVGLAKLTQQRWSVFRLLCHCTATSTSLCNAVDRVILHSKHGSIDDSRYSPCNSSDKSDTTRE
jgi:hypothetical protein